MADVDAQFLRGLFDEEGSLHTAGRTALYRLYGPEGLLYVGITICPLTRIRTHLREQPWGSGVIAVRIDYPEDPEAAERRAVRAEHPRHNVVFNGPVPPPLPDPASPSELDSASNGAGCWSSRTPCPNRLPTSACSIAPSPRNGAGSRNSPRTSRRPRPRLPLSRHSRAGVPGDRIGPLPDPMRSVATPSARTRLGA